MDSLLKERLDKLAATLEKTAPAGTDAVRAANLPSRRAVVITLERLIDILYPCCDSPDATSMPPDETPIDSLSEKLADVTMRLVCQIEAAFSFSDSIASRDSHSKPSTRPSPRERAAIATASLLDALPAIRATLEKDATAAYEGDPAATSTAEVALCYPGFFAITVHRIAHLLYLAGVPIIPRVMSEYAHSKTGIDIHPGASIGSGFFIDHGTGVVIGETTTIGNHVKLYQGVTLGARSFPKNPDGSLVKGLKRHPNVEDDVVIYAGATVLGGETTIGRGSVIGASVWITSSVPPGTKVMSTKS